MWRFSKHCENGTSLDALFISFRFGLFQALDPFAIFVRTSKQFVEVFNF